MGHTRAEVIKRAISEFKLLDLQVSKLTAEEWRLRVPRPETKDPWTIKDALAHITYFKAGVARSARGQRRPPDDRKLNITDENHLLYMKWRGQSPAKILAWHRQVQADLVEALREAPVKWYSRRDRGPDWPFDLDGHSSEHRLKDIERTLKPIKP